MAHFVYSAQQRRRYRKGIWLRVRALPDNLLKQIKRSMKLNEDIKWVEVKELKPNNQVLLEIWCDQNQLPFKMPERYTVFHLIADEDPDWICESDLGRGLI